MLMFYHDQLMYMPNQSFYQLLSVVMKHNLLPSQEKHCKYWQENCSKKMPVPVRSNEVANAYIT